MKIHRRIAAGIRPLIVAAKSFLGATPALLLGFHSWVAPAQAHHSVAGQFDTNARITLTGTVSRVDWVNPHIYVYLDVKNADGTVTTWGLETGPTARFRNGGLTKQDLAGKPGERVMVLGMPARRKDNNSLWLIKIEYESGKYYVLYGSALDRPASE